MLVKELIAKLKELPEDSRVVVQGYEGGVKDVTGCAEVEIALDVNEPWYYGNHEIVTEGDDTSCSMTPLGPAKKAPAVVIA